MVTRKHGLSYLNKLYVLLESITALFLCVECMVLLDGRSSLAGIAGSSFDQLLDCSHSTRSANALTKFFNQDTYL